MFRMLSEIHQQPEALARTLAGAAPAVARLSRALEKRRPKLIVLVARGTSDNAALFGRYLIEITTGIPVSLAAPSIGTLYHAEIEYHDALVVALSQSGESTDTNIVLERARSRGVMTLGITNNSKSTLAGLAEHVFLVRAGAEKSVAATKTYTGQLLLLYLLASVLGSTVRTAELERLPEAVEAALRLEPAIEALSERYRYMRQAVVVGRGLNYANAFEFSLKLMETCYVMAERFSPADLLHGPIALVEPDLPVFAFAPSGATWGSVAEALAKLRKMGAEVIAVTDSSNPQVDPCAHRVIRIPRKLKEMFTPIPYIVPGQLFAAHLAVQKGLDPDRPRTLNKITPNL